MIRRLEAFGAYDTGILPASNKWTSASGVVIEADAGRSGFAGDNAAFFDTALGSVLEGDITCTAVAGVYTVTHGLAFRILTLDSQATLFSVLTAISQFDVIATEWGSLQITQTSGGVLLGTVCETPDGVIPIGTGGVYVELRIVLQTGSVRAIQVRVSDQYGDMNPLAQGALFALVAGEAPTTLRLGGGVNDGPATWYVTDIYQTDGVPASTTLQYNGVAMRNDGYLGNTHVQTFYATADGANLSTGNTPWDPSAGTTAYNLINEHPPDEDTTYISADTTGQLTTCLFESPNAAPFGRLNCSVYAPLFGIQWDGRARTEGTASAIAPVIRRIVTGLLAGDIVEVGDTILVDATSYRYYPQVFDRDPTNNDAPFTFAVFVPAGVGIPGTVEFGVRKEA